MSKTVRCNKRYGGFPKNRRTISGVPIIRNVLFWGLPLFMEATEHELSASAGDLTSLDRI